MICRPMSPRSHEVQREKALRRAQNEAAAARRKLPSAAQLAAFEQPTPIARTDQGKSQPMNPAREGKPQSTRTASLEDRIRQIRADIDAIIEARTKIVAKENPGVPSGVIRNLLTARAPACPCAQYLEIAVVDAG